MAFALGCPPPPIYLPSLLCHCAWLKDYNNVHMFIQYFHVLPDYKHVKAESTIIVFTEYKEFNCKGGCFTQRPLMVILQASANLFL